jgi:hypothetical protein
MALLRPREEVPSMIKIESLWVHQGKPETGAQGDRVIDDVSEERAQSSVIT